MWSNNDHWAYYDPYYCRLSFPGCIIFVWHLASKLFFSTILVPFSISPKTCFFQFLKGNDPKNILHPGILGIMFQLWTPCEFMTLCCAFFRLSDVFEHVSHVQVCMFRPNYTIITDTWAHFRILQKVATDNTKNSFAID